MPALYFDIETRSTADVKKVGPARMAEDPTLQILSVHYAIGDAPVRHWRGAFSPGPGDAAPHDEHFSAFLDAIEEDRLLWAHNCMFDFQVWNACAARYGFPGLRLEQMRDSATVCRALNLPGALGKVAKALGLKKLDNKTYHPLWKIKDQEQVHCAEAQRDLYEEMLRYGDVDVEVMREILRSVPDGVNWEEWIANERINLRGVTVDLAWCRRALEQKDHVVEEVKGELEWLTYGAVKTPKQVAAARAWCEEQLQLAGLLEPGQQITRAFKKRRKGEATFYTEVRPCFDKATRRELRETILERGATGVEHILDLLDLMDEGASAAVAKYQAALDRTCADGRIRGMYIFGGAQQTGRFASTGLQTHNLKKGKFKKPVEQLQTEARTLEELSCLLRPTIIAGG